MQRLEELVESDPERVQIIKKARVTSVNKEGNKVTGVSYEYNGEQCSVDGVVVLATGGYAADFTETSLLKKHRPDTYDLASTNGTHATGDGLKMLMAIGGQGIDLDKVQVHPTGLVDPKDPGSKWKFLAAEGNTKIPSIIDLRLTLMKRYVGREGFYSMARVSDSQMSSATATMFLGKCGRRRMQRDGRFVWCLIPKLPMSSTFILATTLVVV